MKLLYENLLVRFSLVSFVVIAAIATVLIIGISAKVRQDAIDDAVDEAVGSTSSQILRTITAADLEAPMTGERYDKFHEFVQTSLVSDRTARIKLWATDGTVIYSSDPTGVGQKFPDKRNLLKALRGDTAIEIAVPEDVDNAGEHELGTLLEVYTPLIFPGAAKPQGAYEIYQYYAPTAQRINELRLWIIGSIGGGFLVLYILLVFIVWGGWQTISGQRRQLQSVNIDLEDRVDQRTSELLIANEEQRRLAEENAVKAEIGRIISSSLDIDEVYGRFVEQVSALIPFDRLAITLLNEEQENSMWSYLEDSEALGLRRGNKLPLEGTFTERVMKSGSSLLFQTEEEDEFLREFPSKLPFFKAGFRSFIAAPLISKDRIIGALHLRFTTINAYTAEVVALAERVADQIAGAIANAQLYADLNQTQYSLIQAEEKYRNLIESSIDSIIVLKEGKTVYRNRIYEELMGFTVEETADQSFLEMVVPEDREQVRDYYQSRLRGEDVPDQYEVRLLTREKRSVVMEVKPIIISYESQPATMVTMRDITQRKLMQEQLLQAQKMEAVGQLAGGVAHDFNNLLTAILAYSHLGMMKLPTGDPVAGYMKEIKKAGERAAQLTSQLLAFSRRHISEPRVLNLNEISLDTNKMLRHLIGEDVELVVLPSDDLWMTEVDPGQMEQVLINLAVNARDAMPDGGKLTIETANARIDDGFARLHSDLSEGEYVTLSVRDTGTGISEEVMEHIFEPFFTTKEVGKGTGLGLAMCYGIVTQSGGCITVDSELDRGTTFTIYLPRVDVPATSMPLRDESGYLPAGSETVLLVEDEPVLLNVAAHVLREQGYTVLEAANGTDALRVSEECADQVIHLLLTDVVMPLMGGRELADKLRVIRPDISVLFASGYTDDAVVSRDILEGGTQFLQKPFTPSDLARKVKETIQAR